MEVVYKCKIPVAYPKCNHTGSSIHNDILNLITGECIKQPLKSSVVAHIPYLLQLWGYCVNKPWYHERDVHGSVHHNTNLIKITDKMQLCRTIYYSIAPWLLYMFRAILSLIIRSILTVITASGLTHVCRCLLLSWLSHDSSWQWQTWVKPEAVITVKILLMMSDNIAQNM